MDAAPSTLGHVSNFESPQLLIQLGTCLNMSLRSLLDIYQFTFIMH